MKCQYREGVLRCGRPVHSVELGHILVAMPEEEVGMPPTQPGLGMVGGDHYKKLSIDPWAVIKANRMGFFDGNALKYIMRYRHKDGLQDLKKAQHYLEELIRQEEVAAASGGQIGGFCAAAHHRDANDKQTSHTKEADCQGWMQSKTPSMAMGLCSARHGRFGPDGYVEHARTTECVNWQGV